MVGLVGGVVPGSATTGSVGGGGLLVLAVPAVGGGDGDSANGVIGEGTVG